MLSLLSHTPTTNIAVSLAFLLTLPRLAFENTPLEWIFSSVNRLITSRVILRVFELSSCDYLALLTWTWLVQRIRVSLMLTR